MTSMEPGPPRARSRQLSHSPHGSATGACSQFSARARMRADGGLAAAARAGEEVGVVDPVVRQRRAQRLGDVVLPDDLGEGLGPVAAVQREGGLHV